MPVTIRVLREGEEAVLARVTAGVFDNPVRAELAGEFLGDGRHHLAVALDEGEVVGFASGVTYVHPDKEVELWINEVGVAPARRGQGIGRGVIAALLEVGRDTGCRSAWVLTNRENEAAMRLYAGLGGVEANRDQVMFEFALDGGKTAPSIGSAEGNSAEE
jgi:aminoglycoside 6'-N-acetyltransferase I